MICIIPFLWWKIEKNMNQTNLLFYYSWRTTETKNSTVGNNCFCYFLKFWTKNNKKTLVAIIRSFINDFDIFSATGLHYFDKFLNNAGLHNFLIKISHPGGLTSISISMDKYFSMYLDYFF